MLLSDTNEFFIDAEGKLKHVQCLISICFDLSAPIKLIKALVGLLLAKMLHCLCLLLLCQSVLPSFAVSQSIPIGDIAGHNSAFCRVCHWIMKVYELKLMLCTAMSLLIYSCRT